MRSLLVTGGCGFIGANFVRIALTRLPDCRVVNLDKLTYAGNPANLADLEGDPRYRFVHGDICDRALVDTLFSAEGFDAVVHFAAESHVDRSIEGPAEFIRTNITGTSTLLDAARQAWLNTPSPAVNPSLAPSLGRALRAAPPGPCDSAVLRNRHPSPVPHASPPHTRHLFLHVSTDEVYGSLGQTGYFTEETPYDPRSPYSASKASSDHLARAYQHTYGLPVMVTNCSNNYGPYQFPEKLIPLIVNNARSGKELPVYGDGRNVRDWLFVEDHCDALLTVLERGTVGETYNIGGNNEKQNIQIVQTICDLLDERLGALPNGMDRRSLIRFVKDRPGHDLRYAIDATRIREELGWTPSVSFEEGIRRTIDWYVSNETWMASVMNGSYREYYNRMYADR